MQLNTLHPIPKKLLQGKHPHQYLQIHNSNKRYQEMLLMIFPLQSILKIKQKGFKLYYLTNFLPLFWCGIHTGWIV